MNTCTIQLQLCGTSATNYSDTIDRDIFLSLPFGHPLREAIDASRRELSDANDATAKAEADAQASADDCERAESQITGAAQCFEDLATFANEACEDDDGEPVTHSPRVQALIDAVRQLATFRQDQFAAFAGYRDKMRLVGESLWSDLHAGKWGTP